MSSLEKILAELWDESPLVQAERANAWAKGFAESFFQGFAESFTNVLAESFAERFAEGFVERFAERLELPRSLVEMVVNVRFPMLANLAHQKVASLTQPEDFRTLMAQIVAAPDEQTVRELLLPQQSS